MSRIPLALLLVLVATCTAAQSVHIEDLTSVEIGAAINRGKTTAIVYAGSTEQKGPHMATGAHTVVAHHVGGRIAEKLGDALVYPILPFAVTGDPVAKSGHMRLPGSVSLSPEVYRGAMRQVAQSAIAAGFREVYVMGDHGDGQEELKRAAEGLDAQWAKRGVRVRYVPDLYYKTQESVRKYLAERRIVSEPHAGVHDTSELLALDRDGKWLRRDKVPAGATPEMGKVFLDYKVDAAVAQIRALRASGK